MPKTEVKVGINTEFIKLDSLLKMANLVGSGGEAKILIADGEVSVNGENELRRGRKLYPGDSVMVSDYIIVLESE